MYVCPIITRLQITDFSEFLPLWQPKHASMKSTNSVKRDLHKCQKRPTSLAAKTRLHEINEILPVAAASLKAGKGS